MLALRLLERDEGIGFGAGADIPGAVLITGALMLGVYTIVKPRGRARLGLGARRSSSAPSRSALLAAFVVREATPRNPLMPLRIFRSRNVSGANLIQALMVAGMFGMFFLGALYLQRVLGYGALEIGLAFLPVHDRHGHAVAALRRAADHALRRARRAAPRAVLIAAGLALFTPRAGRRQLRRPTCCRR